MTIFREEATSALAGFHGSPLSCSNWNLETFLGGGRKTGESGEKPSELGNNQQQTQPIYTPGRNRTQANTLTTALSLLSKQAAWP